MEGLFRPRYYCSLHGGLKGISRFKYFMRPLAKPPRIKVLEALGAIADGRVKKVSENEFEVVSSEGDRTYRVYVNGNVVDSTDNGTVYRGYVGYPIISALMLLGRLPYDERIAQALKGIDWRKLNEEMKAYWKVERLVLSLAEKRGVKREEVEEFVNKVMRGIEELHLQKR